MKRKFYISIFLYFFSATICHSQDSITTKSKNEALAQKIFPKKTQINFASIVSELAKNGTFESEYIGYSAIKSIQYMRFNQLLTIATDEQLANLTSHYSTAVRAYAFRGLILRKNIIFKKILTENISNKSPLNFQSGCQTGLISLGKWFLNQAQFSLNEEEYKSLEQQL